jgi:hypothetical protein
MRLLLKSFTSMLFQEPSANSVYVQGNNISHSK